MQQISIQSTGVVEGCEQKYQANFAKKDETKDKRTQCSSRVFANIAQSVIIAKRATDNLLLKCKKLAKRYAPAISKKMFTTFFSKRKLHDNFIILFFY